MAGTEVSVMKELKGILATDNVKNRFNEVLGKKAPQFMTSIINVVRKKEKCVPVVVRSPERRGVRKQP